ncbi:hypothetical protein G9A89_021995 [Geosiphon pyriformis]|nr:hypothetical protein G9A89_021995 [Geosiphon pyriformis]
MDLKTASSSNMSKKKAPKGAFYSPAGGSFLQKKKVVLENVKHSDDEKNISLNKSELDNNVFSNVNSVFGNEEGANITGINVRSLLDLAANTPKVKHVNTGVIFGSSFGSPNFIDPKIIKTQVEVFAKKSFTLDINFSAVKGKSAMAKTQLIRKIFSLEIIQSTFTSEESMIKAALLAREKGIIINSDLKRQEIRSDRAVIIKKISMDMPKNMIVATVSEFGKIKSIKIQLIGMWQKTVVEFAKMNQANSLVSKWSFLIGKNSVYVAKVVENYETWAFKDWFRALLFTLPVGTTAHDLGNLLKRAGRKTCIINKSIKTGNKICCAVVSFSSDDDLESAFQTESIFNGVKLSWARIDLVCCKKYGCFGHLALECDIPDAIVLLSSKRSYKKSALEEVHFWLAKLYEKKCVPISCLSTFGGKSWAQMVSLSKFSGSIYSGSGPNLFSHELSGLSSIPSPALVVFSGLSDCLVVLERSLELLADQVSEIIKKLSFMELVLLASKSSVLFLVVSVLLNSVVNSDMAIDDTLVFSILSLVIVVDTVANLSSSSSKVLTSKMGGLKSKLVALEVLVELVLEKLDHLCSSLDLPAFIVSQ